MCPGEPRVLVLLVDFLCVHGLSPDLITPYSRTHFSHDSCAIFQVCESNQIHYSALFTSKLIHIVKKIE